MDSIELISALSCKLQMLYLVLSYGNMSSAANVSEVSLTRDRSNTRRAEYPRLEAQGMKKVPV